LADDALPGGGLADPTEDPLQDLFTLRERIAHTPSLPWQAARQALSAARQDALRQSAVQALREALPGLELDSLPPLENLQPILVLAPGGAMWRALDSMASDLDQRLIENLSVEQLIVGSSAAAATGLSVGYVIWLLRGGSLMLTMMTTLPTWMSFDPLPILGLGRGGRRDDDQESLLQLVQSRRGRPPVPGQPATSPRRDGGPTP